MKSSLDPAARVSCQCLVITAVSAILLTGCGKSADAKREDVVRCSGFSLALMNIRPGSPLMSSLDAALVKDGISASDSFSIGNAAQKYASAMDPAKVTRLAQEGSASAMGLINKNDAGGIADYLKGCVATYKDLGS